MKVIVIAANVPAARELARQLGIPCHPAFMGSPSTPDLGRGLTEVDAVLVDESVWPLDERQLETLWVAMKAGHNGQMYRVERVVDEAAAS